MSGLPERQQWPTGPALAMAPLSESVEFDGTPDEAGDVLGELVRVMASSLSPCGRPEVKLWSSRESFHGIVEVSMDGGTCCLVTVAPTGTPSDYDNMRYRATRQIREIGHGGVISAPEWLPLARLIPMTGSEFAEIRLDMPLTTGLPQRLRNTPLSGFSATFTIHHLSDFLPFIESALALGLAPDAVTVIDKEYPYRDGERVDAHLRLTQGLRVCRYAEIEEAVAMHIRKSEALGKKVLVLDDGGYVLPVVLERYPTKVSCIAGIVEQTMSGINRVAGHTLPVPLFNVAQSDVKATVEAYGVADAAVRNIVALLPHEKFEGRSAVVVGYGRVGEEVAKVLRTRRMDVTVHDADVARLVAAHESGFVTDRSLSALLATTRPLLVVGCAGARSVTAEHFGALQADCYLVSTTSRDREFALADLRELSTEVKQRGALGTCYRLKNGVMAFALGNGFPINFHEAQSLPNKVSDLVLASVLVGACALAEKQGELVPGLNIEASNRVLRDSGLLDEYYRRWAERPMVLGGAGCAM
ncbi:MAG: NAD(P)-dependent oxidoreductase [Solirubrobacteraceae bacterium]